MNRELYTCTIDTLVPCSMKTDTLLEIRKTKISRAIFGWKMAIFWNLSTFGKVEAYVVYDGDKKVHHSFVVKSRMKFPFLKSDDIEIGPCATDEAYRGKGIYPAVLSYIVKEEIPESGVAYMIVKDINTASQRGVMKAGFQKTEYIVRRNWAFQHVIVKK